ncbi:hypothetical protein QBC35DRAFT_395550 [Podospora australis]|uniref:Protein kinase domain-containing protein n=1 Tax=Podospora australis TaxID=1536484 RepID=A0AAN6WIV4_9PEZI|nr:hypothetical protein QBC35DRAFT_395550 [Podospora australis]
MELSSNVFTNVLTPLAVFLPQVERNSAEGVEGRSSEKIRYQPPPTRERYRWRLDGADMDGLRVFAVPLFVVDKYPLRIDVYLPKIEDYPPDLRKALQPEALIYSPKNKIPTLPISQHIIKGLEIWSETKKGDGFEQEYFEQPFGSKIIISKIPTIFPEDMQIELVRDDDVEQVMMGVDELKQMWGLSGEVPEENWPPVIDLKRVVFERQIHECITVVAEPKRYVFKSLLRDQRYMYNELKTILSLRPHDNLVPRPVYIVTHKIKFGGLLGICGFIMEFFEGGSLKDFLLSDNAPPRGFSLRQKFRLAKQVTEVLMHIDDHPAGFYPDLKPDNIVLRRRPPLASNRDSDGKEPGEEVVFDAVLLDLEQRGGWFSWSPPEIAYLEYFEILATKLDGSRFGDLKQGIVRRLRACMTDWRPEIQNMLYQNSVGGFSAPWLALLRERLGIPSPPKSYKLERAQTFMLGKLLWCLFEGQARVRCGIDHEVLQENDLDLRGHGFPEFRHSPHKIQELIKRCTAGAPEWDVTAAVEKKEKYLQRKGIVLRDGKLFPAEVKDGQEVSVENTMNAARQYWVEELERANTFLQELLLSLCEEGRVREGGVLAKAESRPLMGEVLGELVEVERELLG